MCGYCGKPINEGAELHEAIITRGDWQGLPLELISVAENSCLVHVGGKNFGTCHGEAHTTDGELACIRQILHYEGSGSVLGWLATLRPYVRSSVVDVAIRRVITISQYDNIIGNLEG